MSIFDKDLIQKDLSVEDMLREKIIRVASNIENIINEASAHGVHEFPRLSELGSYGPTDADIVWSNRYAAFLDYISFNINVLKEQLNKKPIFHNKKSVLIDNMTVFYDVFKYELVNRVPYRVVVDYSLRSGITPFVRNEQYRTEICFDISLDPPTCHPGESFYFSFPKTL